MSGNREDPKNNNDRDVSRTIIRPWMGKEPRSRIPTHQGYRYIGHEQLRIGKLSLVGLFLMPFWAVAYVTLVQMLGGPDTYSGEISFINALYLGCVLVPVILVHEGFHALAGIGFRVRPYFGVGPGYFYVTFFEPLHKVGFVTVALVPLAAISFGSVIVGSVWPAAAGWILLGSLFNISGSGGDLWMAVRILKQPRHAIFYDLADGFAVFVPLEDQQ